MLFDLLSESAEVIELTSDQINEQAAQITIDGMADDWAALPPIGVDPQGDQHEGSVDLGEVRALVSEGELLLNIQPYEMNLVDHIAILMYFPEVDRVYLFEVSSDEGLFHRLGPLYDWEFAFEEVIEIRIPFWGFQHTNPKIIVVAALDKDYESLDSTAILPLHYVSGDPLTKIDPAITLLPESRQFETLREITEITIDGKVDDWEEYPILTIDPAGDNISDSPDFGEVRAFINSEYFYAMIKLYRPGRFFLYEMMLRTPDTGYHFDFDPRDNKFVVRNGDVMLGVSRRAHQAQGEAVELKIPLFLLEDKNIESFQVNILVDNDILTGDHVIVFAVPIVDEVEPEE